MLEDPQRNNVESSVQVSGTKANGVYTDLAPVEHAGLNGCKTGSPAAASPQENGTETHAVGGSPEEGEAAERGKPQTEGSRGDECMPGSEFASHTSTVDAQRAVGTSAVGAKLENGPNAAAEAEPLKDDGGPGSGVGGEIAPGTAEQKPELGKEGSKQGSIDSSKGAKSREGETDGDKGGRTKSRGGKDSKKDSRSGRSRSKANKDKDRDKEKDKKRSRRSTRSRSRSRRRRGSKHRSPGKLSPPRKRRARGSRSSSRSSSPSPRPRFSRGISPGAAGPPRSRPFGGMQRSPPYSRGAAPPAGPWGYGGGPPYDPHGYGPTRGGYSPPRGRWPGPGRSPPPYGYERTYGPYGGPPPRGSRSPPPGAIYGRNPTTGSPLYGPPPSSQGGPWERALPVEPRPAAQGKVWGARSGWDTLTPDIPARDVPPVARQSPVVPTSSAGAEVSASREFAASRQGVEEAAVPATSRSSRGPQVGDNGWQNGPETTSKPRPSEWSDGPAAAKPESAGSQQYLNSVSAAEAELRAMVHSVDHSDACWYYIDPQGKTQGPCTIRQFREWMRHMRSDHNLHEEFKRFSEVSVWRVGMPFRVKLTVLMAIVVQTSPSPPPSPSPHDGKTFGQHISAR